MAVYNWSNTVTTWHFNPHDVRDPTIVFNNTAYTYGSVAGYAGTQYAFLPINFAPNINVSSPTVWTTIPLDQFGIPVTCKEVILTGNVGITGPNMWSGTIYTWFRSPGSTWNLSPITDNGYMGTLSVHAPVALDSNGIPAIEMAWGTLGLNSTGWGTPSYVDNAWLNLILTGWGE